MEGFNKLALRDLEKLVPLLRYAEPLNYFEVINSYAVELLATDSVSDALHTSMIAVASPFGPFYPEWHETLTEVKAKRKRPYIISPPKEYEAVECKSEPRNLFRDARIQIVIDFMTANLHRNISLRELATAGRLSPSQFSHVFRAQIGGFTGRVCD